MLSTPLTAVDIIKQFPPEDLIPLGNGNFKIIPNPSNAYLIKSMLSLYNIRGSSNIPVMQPSITRVQQTLPNLITPQP